MVTAIIAAVVIAIGAVIVSFHSVFGEAERIVEAEQNRQDMEFWGERYIEKHLNRRFRILAEVKMEKRMRQLMEKVTHRKCDNPAFDPELICSECKINTCSSPYRIRVCQDCCPDLYPADGIARYEVDTTTEAA